MTNGSSNFFLAYIFGILNSNLLGIRILKTIQLVVGGVYTLQFGRRMSKLNFALGIELLDFRNLYLHLNEEFHQASCFFHDEQNHGLNVHTSNQ